MTSVEAQDAFRARFPDAALQAPDPALRATVGPETLHGHLQYLHDQLHFDYMVFVTAVDWPEQARLELVYRLFSYNSKSAVSLRVMLPRDLAKVDSVADIYRTAEWHERETAEMFGIEFVGHPDPRKILLPDEIDGHPLRKDFSHPNMVPLPEVE